MCTFAFSLSRYLCQYSLGRVIHKWSAYVCSVGENPNSGPAHEVWDVALWDRPRKRAYFLAAIYSLAFFFLSFFRPWPMYRRTVSLCWMAAERTGKNGRLLQNSRRRCWLMGKAASPSGTELPLHEELKFTDDVFCSMPSFAIYCTDLVYTLPLLYFYFCTTFERTAWDVFRGLLHIFCIFVLCHWTEIINNVHS